MKGLLKSKLVLTLVAVIMIAAAVVIPLSGSISHSHAAAPMASSTSSSTSSSAGTIPTRPFTQTPITTDASCSTPTPVVSSLTAGDQVSIVAAETTTDTAGAAGETTQKEFLQIQDTATPPTFSQQVTVFNQITSLIFNVTAHTDGLTACILAGTDGPDKDEQGVITFTIAPRAKTITLKGSLEAIGSQVTKSLNDALKTLAPLQVPIDCALDFAGDIPVVYFINFDYTIFKLDYQLATTADPDKQNTEIIDALVGVTPHLPTGLGCVQSAISYLSPTASDTCVLQGGVSFGACVTALEKAILHDK